MDQLIITLIIFISFFAGFLVMIRPVTNIFAAIVTYLKMLIKGPFSTVEKNYHEK